MHDIELGPLERAAAPARLLCAALCYAALRFAAQCCATFSLQVGLCSAMLCCEGGEVLPARLLPTATAVISTDVLVVLIVNINNDSQVFQLIARYILGVP